MRNDSFSLNDRDWSSSPTQRSAARERQQPPGQTTTPQGFPGTMQPSFSEGPPPTTDPMYIPGFLINNIGRSVRAEFVVGENIYLDKTGRLVKVGANYFVLEDRDFHTQVMCDLYSVKFITFLPDNSRGQMSSF